MAISEVLFVVSGLFIGLAFRGGLFLFLLPFAAVALVLAWMNRPRLAGPNSQSTASLPTILHNQNPTSSTPIVTPDLRTEFRNGAELPSQPDSDFKINQIWARANADVDKGMKCALRAIKSAIPQINSIVVFTQLDSPNEWGVRNYESEANLPMDPSARITESSGLLSQLFRTDVKRLLEGDLPSSKSLTYYMDSVAVKSVAAVPMLDYNGNRVGAIVVDSPRPNCFGENTIVTLSSIAVCISMLDIKGFLSAQKHIALQQYCGLYDYQRKFFQTTSVKDIYKLISNYVKDNVAYDRLTIITLDKDLNGRVEICEGVDSEQFRGKRFTPSDKGIFVLSLVHNRPVERSFMPGQKGYIPRINDDEKPNMNIRQIFVMPIAVEQDAKVANVAICLESSSRSKYSNHEKELLKAFAGVAGIAYDRVCLFQQEQDQARRDPLTGLVNRHALNSWLRTEKTRSNRMKYNLGLLMMDIDHFKRVNDTYGHPVGDVVIKGIANAISSEIRKDIDVVARYGGEEFVVGMVDTTAEGMLETAERIRKSVEKISFDVHLSEPLKVTVSIGAFLVPSNFEDMNKALKHADQALYRAKESGRNRVIRFEQIVDEAVSRN